MRLEIIQAVQIVIIALLSYIPTVAITGWFEAWVAKKCGDDVPEQFGFLTIDPLVHFNLIGFGFLLVGKLLGDYFPYFQGIPGWGRYMPLNPSEHGGWKVALEFNARAIAHLVLAVISIACIIQFMKAGYLGFDWSPSPQAPSYITSIINILHFFYNQNMMLCVIYFAIGTFRTCMAYWFPNFYIFSSENILLGMLILFGAIIICAEAFNVIVRKLMSLMIYLLVM